MKQNDLRQLHLKMNYELLIAIENTLTKFAFLLSLQGALEGKDDLDEEERFCEETFQWQEKLYNIYLPFIKEMKSTSKALEEITTQAEIISLPLLEDIVLLLQYKEELSSLSSSPFSPYQEGEDLEMTTSEFYYRLVIIYRIHYWLNDIETGIQQYGLSSYNIKEDNASSSLNIIDDVADMDLAQLQDEACRLLLPQDEDTIEQQQSKKALIDLCIAIEKLGGKQHD